MTTVINSTSNSGSRGIRTALKITYKTLEREPTHYLHETTINVPAIPLVRDFKEYNKPLDWITSKDMAVKRAAMKDLLDWTKSKIKLPGYINWKSDRIRCLPKIEEMEVLRLLFLAEDAGAGKSTLSGALAVAYAIEFPVEKRSVIKMNFTNARALGDNDNPECAATFWGESVNQLIASDGRAVQFSSITHYAASPVSIGGDEEKYYKLSKASKKLTFATAVIFDECLMPGHQIFNGIIRRLNEIAIERHLANEPQQLVIFNGDPFQNLPMQEYMDSWYSTPAEDSARQIEQATNWCGRVVRLTECLRDKGGVFKKLRHYLSEEGLTFSSHDPVAMGNAKITLRNISEKLGLRVVERSIDRNADYYLTFRNSTAVEITTGLLQRKEFITNDRLVSRKDFTAISLNEKQMDTPDIKEIMRTREEKGTDHAMPKLRATPAASADSGVQLNTPCGAFFTGKPRRIMRNLIFIVLHRMQMVQSFSR